MVGGTSDVAGDLAWLLSEAGYKVYFSGSIHLPTMVAAHPDQGLLAIDIASESHEALLELNRKIAHLRNDVPVIDRTPILRVVVGPDATQSGDNIWTADDARSGRIIANLPPRPLDPSAIAALEARFAPRLTINVPIRTAMEDADSTQRAALRLQLDQLQHDAATRPPSDILIVTGPPGSGKTLVLVARAKWFATQHPSWRIMILCYNRLLVPYLEELTWGHANIHVLTFGQFASSLHLRISLNNEEWADRDAARAVRQMTPKFDAFLVDEWQDFMNAWTQIVFAAVRTGRGGLTVVGDPNQALYRDADPASILRGKTIDHVALERPYRSTRQILEVTSALDDSLSVRGRELAMDGQPVDLVWAANATEIARAVARDVELLIANEERTPQQIGILVTRKWDIGTVLHALKQSGIPAAAVYPNHADAFDLSAPCVKVMTVHSAKGYEFDVVFLLGMEYLRDLDGTDRAEHEGRTGYVGATRAKDQLVLTYSRENSYLDRIRSLPHDLVRGWVWPDDYPEVT